MSNLIYISKDDFKEVILREGEKYQPVNLVSATEPDMYKKGNPYAKGLLKIQHRQVFLGSSYEQRVRNNEAKEGLAPVFKAQTPIWSKHIGKSLLCHKDDEKRLYVAIEPFLAKPPYKTDYEFNGQPIAKVMFEAFLKDYNSQPTTQVQDKKVFYLTYSFDSIKEMTINGTRYILQ